MTLFDLHHVIISAIIIISLQDFSTVADTSCSRSYSAGPTGTITSYNYPFNYTSNLRCQYIIQIPYTGDNYYYATKRVCFTFHRFKLESYLNHASEPVDYLAFITIDDRLVKYCGDGEVCQGAPPGGMDTVWTENFCWDTYEEQFIMMFVSDNASQMTGFYMTYSVSPSDVRDDNVSPSGIRGVNTDNFINNVTDVRSGVKATCADSQWRCFSRDCVDEDLLCDGVVDCQSDREESDETYAHARCMPDTAGIHTPSIRACDFYQHNGCEFTGLGQGWWQSSGSNDPKRGPVQDHTEAGGFAMTEFLVSEMSSASLSDYTVSVPPTQNVCLSFWYHMYGYDAGTLQVYFTDTYDLYRPLWTREGNYGNVWRHGEFQISSTDDVWYGKIKFVSKHGSDVNTRISLDDIALTLGTCSGEDISCNWEIGWCGWSSNAWYIAQEGGDHSSEGKDGSYVMYEGNHEGSIRSPIMTSMSAVCLVLWTRCEGDCLLSLSITDIYNQDDPISSVQPSNQWEEWATTIMWYAPYKVTLTGQGIVKVDQVSLTEGHCNEISTGSCEVGQFRCTDGECIALSMLCDGSTSCSDGSDETDSACHGCPLGKCSDDEFCCRDGECIDQIKVCDGYNDCGDYYDEDDCEAECTESLCPSGRCISDDAVCDGKPDCPDGADEQECSSNRGSLHTGAIIGIIAGCTALLVVFLIRCILYYYKHQRRFICCVLWDSGYCSRCRDDESNCTDDTTPSEIDPTLFQPPPSYEDAVQAGARGGGNHIDDEADKYLPPYSEVLAGGYSVVSTPSRGASSQGGGQEGMGHPSTADVPPPRYHSIHRQGGMTNQRTSRPPTYQANPDYNTAQRAPSAYDNAGFSDVLVIQGQNVNQRSSYPGSSIFTHEGVTRPNTYHGRSFQEGAPQIEPPPTENGAEAGVYDLINEGDIDPSVEQLNHLRGTSADSPTTVSPTGQASTTPSSDQSNQPITYHDNLGFMNSGESLSVESNDPHQTLENTPAETTSHVSRSESTPHISGTSHRVPELTLQPSGLRLDRDSATDSDMHVRRRVSLDDSHHTEV